jgi:hypothetical protein
MKAEYPSLWTIPDGGVVDESWRFDKVILLTKVASIRVTGTLIPTPLCHAIPGAANRIWTA